MRVARSRRRPRVVVGAAVVAVLVGAAAAAIATESGGQAALRPNRDRRAVARQAPGLSSAPSTTAPTATAPTATGPTATAPSTTAPTATGPPTTSPSTTATTSPGNLPQTTAVPSAGTPQFDAEMAALWDGVVTGTVAPAMPAFFPEAAYLRLKTIYDPGADYEDRLVAEYAADLAAAHALLGADASSATLVGVDVPSRLVHWVTPGTCENDVGYYEVPNARVVYEEGGAVRSFGIASLISWRGVWYVVHLGAVLESASRGVVDDPAVGPGFSAPYLTC